MSVDKPVYDFEHSIKTLEALVETMEKGELNLEESLQAFEQGIALTRSCQKALTQAEQRVNQLLENTEMADSVPFNETNNADQS